MAKNNELSHLIERHLSGDEDSFAQIYACFSKNIYYNAIKLLGNEDDAKDVLQEVMLYLYRHMADIADPKSLPLYLYRTTYSMAMNILRKKYNLVLLGEELEVMTAQQQEWDIEFLPEEYAEQEERRRYITGILDELPPSYRAVLLMFYYDQLTLKEIAEAMDMDANTVRVKLQRSRRALRRKLEKDPEKQDVMLRAASVPVLTRIMQRNADELFRPETNTEAWAGIAGQLGVTASIAATTVATTASVATVTALTGGKIIAALLALSLGAAMLWSAPSGETQPPSEPVIHKLRDNSLVAISIGEPIGETIEIPNHSAITGPPPLAESVPDIPAAPHTTDGTAEADASAVASGTTPVRQGGLQAKTDLLTYPKGTELTREKILRDAGITPLDYTLDTGGILLYGLEEIDTSVPDKYAVELALPTEKQQVENLLAVVIIITE